MRIEQAQALEMVATKYGAREVDTRGVRSSLAPLRLSTLRSPLFLAYYAQMFSDNFSDASCSGFHQKSGNQPRTHRMNTDQGRGGFDLMNSTNYRSVCFHLKSQFKRLMSSSGSKVFKPFKKYNRPSYVWCLSNINKRLHTNSKIVTH